MMGEVAEGKSSGRQTHPMGAVPEPVIEILEAVGAGDAQAAEQLLPLVYDELRRLAAARMAQQPPGQTLQPTALVHEAWLKVSARGSTHWEGRQHFFRAAAEAMRQILIDRARAKQRLKRGADYARVNLDELEMALDAEPETLLLLDEAMELLGREHPEKAELIKLRFYAGLSIEESAQALGVSPKTVQRQWVYARAWLFREIQRLMSR